MKFGQIPVPEKLFDLARERIRMRETFTPEDVRRHLMSKGAQELAEVTSIEVNKSVIVNRVTRACIDELRESGEVAQFKRGLWAKSSFLASSQ